MTEQEQAWARKAEAELELSRKIKEYGSIAAYL
jgi:hypothetical protein